MVSTRYANPKVRGSNPGLNRLRIFMTSVKTRLSTLGTGDVPCGSDTT